MFSINNRNRAGFNFTYKTPDKYSGVSEWIAYGIRWVTQFTLETFSMQSNGFHDVQSYQTAVSILSTDDMSIIRKPLQYIKNAPKMWGKDGERHKLEWIFIGKINHMHIYVWHWSGTYVPVYWTGPNQLSLLFLCILGDCKHRVVPC